MPCHMAHMPWKCHQYAETLVLLPRIYATHFTHMLSLLMEWMNNTGLRWVEIYHLALHYCTHYHKRCGKHSLNYILIFVFLHSHLPDPYLTCGFGPDDKGIYNIKPLRVNTQSHNGISRVGPRAVFFRSTKIHTHDLLLLPPRKNSTMSRAHFSFLTGNSNLCSVWRVD